MTNPLRQFITAPINCTASGNNTVIFAITGCGFRIWKLWLTAASAVNVTYFDGASTALSGPVGLVANGSQTLNYDGTPHFSTSIGNAFIINLSAPVQISGMVYYTRG
jgi:hypothetical protein